MVRLMLKVEVGGGREVGRYGRALRAGAIKAYRFYGEQQETNSFC